MRTIVVGGTGTVGARVTAALRAADVAAVPVSRRAAPGGIAADLTDPAALETAAAGAEAAFLITPVGPDESAIGVAAVTALRAAGVAKIVYLSIANLEAMAEIPHFACKIPVKAAVLAEPRAVVLEANFFFQNDLFVAPLIAMGVYGVPLGRVGVHSVSADDIAAAAVRALTRPDWDGTAVPVCGPERMTGEGLAANWSAATGRTIAYGGDAIEPFVEGLARVFPDMDDWYRHDYATMMRVTQALGCLATPQDQARSAEIIGRPPMRHAAFATEAARTLGLASQGTQP